MKSRVVNSKEIVCTNRLDGSFHNADINVYEGVISKHSKHSLSHYCSRIYTSGRNKRIYTTKEFGYPFLSNSDVAGLDPFNSCKYSSKKYSLDEDSILREGMILTGRVGAIGQTSFVLANWEKKLAQGSDNIIRIVVKPTYKNGFIYAYLASRFGNLSFWKRATGGVQPFITDEMVGHLPIPDFPDEFQSKVDALVQESAKLREEATEALEKAKKIIEDFVGKSKYEHTYGMKKQSIKVANILSSFKTRLDPTYYVNDGIDWIKSLDKEFVKLEDCNIKIWYPGIFKRAYVQDGYPYIKGSSMFLVNPFKNCDNLSKTHTPNLKELWLKEGMVMMSCAGICGQVKIITKEYEDKNAIGSPDIIRIASEDELFTSEYLFAYFQLPGIYDYLQSLKYGSVIERFDTYNLLKTPIVKPTKDLSKEVTSCVKQYMECTYKAFNSEEQAISLVETEIEKWNQ